MIKLVLYLSLFFAFPALALMPVEGLLMGEAQKEIQLDPLSDLFRGSYDKSNVAENEKLKFYQSTFLSGQNLHESCGYLGRSTYSSRWQETQAQRSIAATLQYIGLDATIKAIGAYAQKLEVGAEDFKRLSANLVKNYCSKNITVFSLRNIEKSLGHYYQNPLMGLIPSIETSPFTTKTIKTSTEGTDARSREFDWVIKNFRAFCSWGGEVDDYRMMTSYLSNRFIMAFVINNMNGIQKFSTASDSVQVACTDLICRRESASGFKQKFPLSIGSTGISTDLPKLYCHHFRHQDSSRSDVTEIKNWIKKAEIEDSIFETSQFISLMTGVPDLFHGVQTYKEVPFLLKSSIDERWNSWANDVLMISSKDLLYEESLRVKVEPRRDVASLATDGFFIDFNVTLGEMDRILTKNDKLDLTFNLKLSKNYLRSIRRKWNVLSNEIDNEGKKEFQMEIARYINLQLRQKQKLFSQKMWNDELSKLIAEELVQQIITYRGQLFDSYQEEVLKVPVKFSYGLFALSYIKYRADLGAGRLKLNL